MLKWQFLVHSFYRCIERKTKFSRLLNLLAANPLRFLYYLADLLEFSRCRSTNFQEWTKRFHVDSSRSIVWQLMHHTSFQRISQFRLLFWLTQKLSFFEEVYWRAFFICRRKKPRLQKIQWIAPHKQGVISRCGLQQHVAAGTGK